VVGLPQIPSTPFRKDSKSPSRFFGLKCQGFQHKLDFIPDKMGLKIERVREEEKVYFYTLPGWPPPSYLPK